MERFRSAVEGRVTFDERAPTGWDNTILMHVDLLQAPLAGLPGLAWSWWRYRSFAERFGARAVQKRYAEVTRELTDARRIHEALFPPPITRGPVRVAYRYEPMREIGVREVPGHHGRLPQQDRPGRGIDLVHDRGVGLRLRVEHPVVKPISIVAHHFPAKRFPDMHVSAGTVLTPAQFDMAADLGASLFISPGLTEVLAEHALKKGYAWVPGVATASEVMRALELGFELLKFFPAMAAGGPKALAGITAPLAAVRIVPTGGVTLENMAQWREVKAVQAVGGTWLTTGLDQASDIAKVVEQRAALALAAWNGLIQA